jgi:hypothetical protein
LKQIYGEEFVEIKPKKHQITIFKKNWSRSISNHDDLVKHITQKYKNQEIEVVEIDPSRLSIKDQINLMLKTTLLITPCGGISMIGFFLTSGSSLISTDFPGYQGEDKFTSDHMEAYFWNSLFWINDLYYSIEDYSEIGRGKGPLKTPDPFDCDPKTKNATRAKYEHIRSQTKITINFEKMDKLIEHSLFIMSN